MRACPSSSPIDDRWLTGDESSIAGSASTATCSRFISASIRGCRLPKGGSVRPTTLTFLPRTFAEFRDLIEELLEELGLEICAGLFASLSLASAVMPMVCITGNFDFSGRRSLALAVLEPVDVGREGVDALDADFALGATFVADDDAFSLSSSVELSTDCTTVSSAVDSPAAGAATSPLKVHAVSALDPEVILDAVFRIPTSVRRQSLRLII